MKYLITAVLLISNITLINQSFSEEKKFEINQENCNLPMSKIRQLLPTKEEQIKALNDCIAKASQENWGKSKMVQKKKKINESD